jgi:hypothetical protein
MSSKEKLHVRWIEPFRQRVFGQGSTLPEGSLDKMFSRNQLHS